MVDLFEKGEKIGEEICKKYKITLIDGVPQKPENHEKIGLSMTMEYIGMAYTLGNLLYDGLKSEEEKEKAKDLGGRMGILKFLLVNCLDYKPFYEPMQ